MPDTTTIGNSFILVTYGLAVLALLSYGVFMIRNDWRDYKRKQILRHLSGGLSPEEKRNRS